MTAENFQHELRKVYHPGQREVTPFQIQREIEKQTFLRNLSQETQINNLALLEEIFHTNGKALTLKVNNFKETLKVFRESYPEKSEEMLKYIDVRCFRKDGRVVENRLRKLYKRYNS